MFVLLLLLPHLGNQLEAQICQCSSEVPHILEPACYFCYFKKTPTIKKKRAQALSVTFDTSKSKKNQYEKFYPIFRTRLASARKSARLVPMSDRQNTAMSTEASPSGTCTGEERVCLISSQFHRVAGQMSRQERKPLTLAMSQTVTSSQTAARSKLCTLFFTLRAILQSPQPKSATTRDGGLQGRRCVTLRLYIEMINCCLHAYNCW